MEEMKAKLQMVKGWLESAKGIAPSEIKTVRRRFERFPLLALHKAGTGMAVHVKLSPSQADPSKLVDEVPTRDPEKPIWKQIQCKVIEGDLEGGKYTIGNNMLVSNIVRKKAEIGTELILVYHGKQKSKKNPSRKYHLFSIFTMEEFKKAVEEAKNK